VRLLTIAAPVPHGAEFVEHAQQVFNTLFNRPKVQDVSMTALKTAAHNLINTHKEAEKTPGNVKLSIIPFAVDVNAGTGNVDASWIDWTDWDAANGNCSKSSYHSKSSCNNNGGTWTPKNHNVWNGCVNDRE
jgi:hypothetical protein